MFPLAPDETRVRHPGGGSINIVIHNPVLII